MIERISLRPITPGEFDAFCAVPVEAFNDPDRHPESNEHERIVFEFDRRLAAFAGDEMVGTTAACSFRLTVPGAVVGAGGVTFVSVLPSHRRRGILSAMMRHQLADIAARGEPVARCLRPSRSSTAGMARLRVQPPEPDDPPWRGRAQARFGGRCGRWSRLRAAARRFARRAGALSWPRSMTRRSRTGPA